MSYSYNIEHPNAMDVKGYLATVTVYPLSEDPNKCFVEWKGLGSPKRTVRGCPVRGAERPNLSSKQ